MNKYKYKLSNHKSVKISDAEDELLKEFCNDYHLNTNTAIRIAIHNLISKNRTNEK